MCDLKVASVKPNVCKGSLLSIKKHTHLNLKKWNKIAE